MPFDIALGKVTRDYCLRRTKTILTKSVQLLDFADNVDTIARSSGSVTDVLTLDRGAMKMALVINANKTN